MRAGGVVEAGDGERPVFLWLGKSAGAEEPDLVVENGSADRALVHRRDLVHGLIGGIRRQRSPAVVIERRAKRSTEGVSTRFRDHVHDPAAEAAVLGGNR